MVDGLATPAADVRDDAVPAIGDPFIAGDPGRDGEEPAEERPIRLGQLGRRRDVPARDDQDVGRRARLKVAEANYQAALDNVRGFGADLHAVLLSAPRQGARG